MKNQSQPPEAIILTMPVAFFKEREMDQESFGKYFERFMRRPESLWNYKKKQLPTEEVAWVYLVWNGKVQFRLNFVQYERNKSKTFNDTYDGKVRKFPKMNWIILSGPAIPAPYEIPMKGFQGHRYTQKIF